MYFEVIFTYSTISNFNIIQVRVHFFIYQNVPQKVAECPKKVAQMFEKRQIRSQYPRPCWQTVAG